MMGEVIDAFKSLSVHKTRGAGAVEGAEAVQMGR